jgi:hypothetical protein
LLSLPRGAFSHSICIIHGGLKLVFQDCPRNRDYLQAQRMTNREDKHDSLRSNGCSLQMINSFNVNLFPASRVLLYKVWYFQKTLGLATLGCCRDDEIICMEDCSLSFNFQSIEFYSLISLQMDDKACFS